MAVEGGVEDDGEAVNRIGLALALTLEGGAEAVDRDTLLGEESGIFAREGYVVGCRLDSFLFLAATLLAAESLDAVETEVVGDEVGVAVEV